ncbi:MAG: glycosyl transferase, family 2 [Paenibacillaceae bacterium]|jgi:hypothetical protein|nr:glycosyl transferase, family 2 [Paenibacillaceae bacterium]
MSAGYVEQAKPGIMNWLESVRWKEEGWGRWKYNAKMIRDYGLIPSANAILILDRLGELDNIDQALKNEAAAFLQSCQDQADGYFKDPLVTESDRYGKHSWEDIWNQMGTAAVALEKLGAEPKISLPMVSFSDLETVDIREWVLSLNWTNPWHVGERYLWSLRSYLRKKGGQIDLANDRVLQELFETYEQDIHDPVTGMPRKRGCDDPSVSVAGLFKVYLAYKDVGRPLPNATNAIDYTLAIQHPDGEFGMRRNMCINWDSLWVLRELDIQLKGSYRHDEIVAAGNRTAQLMLDTYRKPDGGFAFQGETCWPVHHSIRISDEYPIGDMTGTSMCLSCLEYADEWNS